MIKIIGGKKANFELGNISNGQATARRAEN